MSSAGEKLSGLLWLLGIGSVFVGSAAIISWMSNRPAPTVIAPVPPTAINTVPTSTVIPALTGISSPFPAAVEVPWFQPVVVVVSAKDGKQLDLEKVVVRVGDSPPLELNDGQFQGQDCSRDLSIRAWAPGYEIASELCDGNSPDKIELTPLRAVDNSYYVWSSALNNCNNCHGNQFVANPQTGATFDEVNEWFRSGHGKVFKGGYFESMYKGTSVTGKPSIPAQAVIIDNEWVPVPAEVSHLYHGPGFKLDSPYQAGTCAYCHVPASIPASQAGVDLYNLFSGPEGTWGEGVTCDVCHKAFEVILADDQNPFPNRPGVLSYRFLRPDNGEFIIGPFSNILTKPKTGLQLTVDHRSTCTPLFSQSEFCAPCHFGKFGDMVIYNSYGEWKASPYAVNREASGYRSCQDCHMSHLYDKSTDVPWSGRQACSPNNREFQNFDHNLMDFGMDVDTDTGKTIEIPRMIKGAAKIDVSFGSQSPSPNTLNVNVNVTNIRAGHKFPTDSPLRHLILVVSVLDRVDIPLIQVAGDRIPNWGGPGPISPEGIVDKMNSIGIQDYGGLSGEIFANLLVEEETNLSPGIAYWNETKHALVDTTTGKTSDTRLVPGVPDPSIYSFAMPDEGDVTVTVRLLYRFAFYDLMVWKEWFDRPDILVTEVVCRGMPRDPAQMTCGQTEPPLSTSTATP